MAVIPTNTRLTYGAICIREDLSNIIYNIAPEDTPFMSAVGKSSCDNTYFEWQIDTLDGGNDNRIEEGMDASVIAVDEPLRVGTTRRSAPRQSRHLAPLRQLTLLDVSLRRLIRWQSVLRN